MKPLSVSLFISLHYITPYRILFQHIKVMVGLLLILFREEAAQGGSIVAAVHTLEYLQRAEEGVVVTPAESQAVLCCISV